MRPRALKPIPTDSWAAEDTIQRYFHSDLIPSYPLLYIVLPRCPDASDSHMINISHC